MRAALLSRFDTPVAITDLPDPACPRDGAVIAVRACGVCRSDHHAWKGADPDVALPHVMGHEFAGDVIETGPECRAFQPGDRVTAPFILGCGTCADCRGGEPTTCDRQQVIGFSQWGAFAERIAIARADFNLVRLPGAMEYAAAAGMGCRVTTAFRALVDRARLAPGEWVAVHGCGGVGLSAILIAQALGARILAVDVNPAALALARDLGATATLDASTTDDTGAAVHDSLKSRRKTGRHVQVGMPLGPHATPGLPLLDMVYARQITLHGTRGIGAHRFAALMGMIEAGRLDPARLVTHRIGLSGLNDALAALDGYGGAGVTVVGDMAG